MVPAGGAGNAPPAKTGQLYNPNGTTKSHQEGAERLGYAFDGLPRPILDVLVHWPRSVTALRLWLWLWRCDVRRPKAARRTARHFSSTDLGLALGLDPSAVRKALRQLRAESMVYVAHKGGTAPQTIRVEWDPRCWKWTHGSDDAPVAAKAKPAVKDAALDDSWSDEALRDALKPRPDATVLQLNARQSSAPARRRSYVPKAGSLECYFEQLFHGRFLYPDERGMISRHRTEHDYLDEEMSIAYCDERVQQLRSAGKDLPVSAKFFAGVLRDANGLAADNNAWKVDRSDRLAWEPDPPAPVPVLSAASV